MTEQINHIPMVPIRGLTVFPGMAVHFDVVRIKSMESVQQAMLAGQKVFLIKLKSRRKRNYAVPVCWRKSGRLCGCLKRVSE